MTNIIDLPTDILHYLLDLCTPIDKIALRRTHSRFPQVSSTFCDMQMWVATLTPDTIRGKYMKYLHLEYVATNNNIALIQMFEKMTLTNNDTTASLYMYGDLNILTGSAINHLLTYADAAAMILAERGNNIVNIRYLRKKGTSYPEHITYDGIICSGSVDTYSSDSSGADWGGDSVLLNCTDNPEHNGPYIRDVSNKWRRRSGTSPILKSGELFAVKSNCLLYFQTSDDALIDTDPIVYARFT